MPRSRDASPNRHSSSVLRQAALQFTTQLLHTVPTVFIAQRRNVDSVGNILGAHGGRFLAGGPALDLRRNLEVAQELCCSQLSRIQPLKPSDGLS